MSAQTETKQMTTFENTRMLVLTAMFTAIIAVLAQISIPMPAGVPMTLQTFAIPLAGIILGPKYGLFSALLYVLLGAVGVPVFAGFTGGFGIIAGPTGGFILSFPVMAWLAGLGAKEEKAGRTWAGLVLGAVFNYAAGTLLFMAITGSSLPAALAGCVLPFLPTAVIKILASGTLGMYLRRTLKKAKLL